MSSQFEVGQGRQLGDLSFALRPMQDAQTMAAALHTTVSTHMTEMDRVVAELRDTLARESLDALMAGASATTLADTPPIGARVASTLGPGPS